MTPIPLNVLWIDDEEDNITLLLKDLTDFVKDHTAGEFNLIVNKKHNSYDKDLVIEAQRYIYQLIITDVNLLKNTNGADFVKYIRDKERIYTSVLIYSSDIKLLNESTKGMDGIYRHATLTGLKTKIIDILWHVINRENFAHFRFKDFYSI